VMPGSRLNTKNRVSLKTSVLTIVIHTAVACYMYGDLSHFLDILLNILLVMDLVQDLTPITWG